MQTKIIKAVLKKKVSDWISSIDDENVKKLVKENTIITGGSIVSLLLNEKPKDYDIYFKNKETVLEVAKYYVKKFVEAHPNGRIPSVAEEIKDDKKTGRIKIFIKSYGTVEESGFDQEYEENIGVTSENEDNLVEPFADIYDVLTKEELEQKKKEENEKDKYRPVFLTSNAITLSNKIQLIIRFYGNIEEIHSTYDFVHCTNYYDYKENHLELKKEALECILSKTLIYRGSKYPVCSVIRTRKFIKQGWHINAGQYLKMIFQISCLDLTNLEVLEDQLIGVDSAYFDQLINALKEHKEKNDDFKVESTYLNSIIDKIF